MEREVPVQSRSERFKSFDVTSFPAVTGREVDWKFTPVVELDDLLSGRLDGRRVQTDTADASGISMKWIDRSDPVVGAAGMPGDRASANAWSQFGEAFHIDVTGDDPKVAVVSRSGEHWMPRAAHTVIEARPQSRGLIVLHGEGDIRLSENVEILVGEGAELTVVSLQEWNEGSSHLASHFARLGRDAKLKHVIVSLGGDVVRINPTIQLAGQGSEAEALGLYFARAGQHLEQQVYVHHDAPRTRSRVNYKGALQGEGARAVWIGDVLIGSTATGTDSYEQNRNLLLSDGTRADSVPNLEIATGDIEGAGHASATGRFDDEQLFYLQARGIPELEARRLVAIGFLTEVIQKIGHPPLEQDLIAQIEQRIASGTSHELLRAS